MNAIHFLQPTTTNRRSAARTTAGHADPAPQPASTRHTHRERDFGVGYGNSSGYASNRRYASNWAPPRFTCA